MPSTRTPEGGKPAPPFKHPGKMHEPPQEGTKRKSFVQTDGDIDMPKSLTRGERRTDDRPMGRELGSDKSTRPKKAGDAARKAQEWGGGAKGAKGPPKNY
jgi:hypothetical protein